MECEEIRNRLADSLTADAAAPGGEGGVRAVLDEVRGHLASCPACREEAEALMETWTALGTLTTRPPDSAAMRRRFDAMLDAYIKDQRPGPAAWAQARVPWFREWRGLQAATAAVVLLLTGGVAGGILAGKFEGLAGLGGFGSRSGPDATAPPSTDAQIAALRRELRDTQQLVMLSLLQQASANERLRGVGWSHEIDEPGPEVVSALLDSLTHDPNVNVRLGCVDALMRFSTRPAVRQGIVRALNESTSPIVQIALIDFVVEIGEKESVAALRRLSADATLNEAVRQRARWGLEHLM